jgi:hypothetical protein
LTQSLLSSARLFEWNFGSLDQRLDPGAYLPVFVRVGTEIAGPLWLGLLFAVCGIILAPTKVERARLIGWLVTGVAGPLLFFNLYLVHDYYLVGIFPAIVAAVGIGIVAVSKWIRANTIWAAAAGTALIAAGSGVRQDDLWRWATSPAPMPGGELLALPPDYLVPVLGCEWDPTALYYARGRGLMLRDNKLRKHEDIKNRLFSCDMWQWAISPVPNPDGARIRANTRPDDLILVVGCDWDPTTLYYADRRGLMLYGADQSGRILYGNDIGLWKRENINDYHYLFSCDQALPVARYVPAGHVLNPTSEPGLWRIVVP